MLVLIDESGDPGFKVAKGSSPTFVVAMVVFRDFKEAERASLAIDEARRELRVKPEFKFNKCHPEVRDGFFRAVADCDFKVRVLVVVKSRIYSRHLRDHTRAFYSFFLKLLLEHDNDVLDGARVKIDGSGAREFKRNLGGYLRQEVGTGKISSLKFVDSKKDRLVQLADMCAGAIARAYNPRVRKDATRWHEMLRQSGKIGDIWEFE